MLGIERTLSVESLSLSLNLVSMEITDGYEHSQASTESQRSVEPIMPSFSLIKKELVTQL